MIRQPAPGADNGLTTLSPLLPFIASIEAPPGYSTQEFPSDQFLRIIQSRDFRIDLTPADETCPTLVILTLDLVRLTPSAPSKSSKGIKCVVFDLDETLWTGALLEDSEVVLRPGVAELLETLDRRGILLSIASKNDEHSALEQLKKAGIADYFVYPKINWLRKSHNIRSVAADLNIGLDSLLFVDDSPFERSEVCSQLPMVRCLDAKDLLQLAERNDLAPHASNDAGNRRLSYQQEVQRKRDRDESGLPLTEFLRHCEIKLTVSLVERSDHERVFELAQRTNQLNFSAKHYDRRDTMALLRAGTTDQYILRCEDKYGSYGSVGFSSICADESELRIEEFMLSCRVQGKYVEQAFLAALLQLYYGGRPVPIWVNYTPTARNIPALQVLTDLGFRPVAERSGMLRDALLGSISCDFISVSSPVSKFIVSAHQHE
jgi:FkbH-like protein